ncbi:MAG TPA: hypothetical protein VJ908_06290 [Wenzhouxiangellaceae bacterium]|nr:hypothetical protein [Wenzhouxiangellaceae bacterium]HMB39531.1 hypothetical protein [Wenzhouxiangellaceae bacterium]
MKKLQSIVACGFLAGVSVAGAATAAEESAWDISGDLRFNLYAENWRDTRSGGTDDNASYGSRFRLRLKRDVGENCRFQTRFAATAADQGNDWDFYIRTNRDTGTQVNPGTATFDEFFVQCESADSGSQWRFGRMQSNLDLPQMATRSLDRSQASSLNIGWTDAIAFRQQLGRGWYGELLAQYNGRDGNGQATRGPLTFDDSDARVGFFGILGSDAEVGPVFMRALAVTVYPDALAPAGLASALREDYVTATFKLGAGWDLGDSSRRLVAVGEIGQAFETPERFAVGLPGTGDADGWGWQLGADLVDVFPRHTIGLNYGRADAGWLISNDFRQNNELAEFRWQFKYSSALRFEFRARWRRELDRLAGAEFLQRDRDVRLRTTWKF